MKLKLIVSLIAIGLAGCAASPENKLSWEMKPVLNVRHGMAEAVAFYQIGRNRQAQGHLAGAEAAYEKSLAIDPENVDAMNALGALYAERGELDRAAALYKRVAELSPKRAYLYNNIGYALHLQGRHVEAIEALRQAVTIDPGYERAWTNLQNVARKAGMAEVAALAAQHMLLRSSSPPAVLAKAEETKDSGATSALETTEVKLHLTQLLNDQASPPAVSADVASATDVKSAGASVAAPKLASSVSKHQAIQMTEVTRIVQHPSAVTSVNDPVAKEPKGAMNYQGPAMLIKASTSGVLATPPSSKVRLEVSNGNGISGFASRVRAQLRSDGFGVSRMTNFTQFTVRRTVIEYRGGFVDAAMSLKNRLGSQVILREAKYDRPGTDVRLILGTDRLAKNRVLSEVEGDSHLAQSDPDLEKRVSG